MREQPHERSAGPPLIGPVIGLVGGIGSGKSEVARILGTLGAEVFPADRIANDLLEDPAVKRELIAAFGREILGPEGTVDRPSLARVVFASEDARARVNSIIHPRVIAELKRRLESQPEASVPRPMVLDVPLLLETELHRLVDVLVFVDAPRAQREERVVGKRGWSADEIARREAFQVALAEKQRRADFVVRNDGSLADLEREVRALWHLLLDRRRPRPARRDALDSPLTDPPHHPPKPPTGE